MNATYVVILWRRAGARWGAADSVTSYTYRRQMMAERNAAAFMAFDADTVATVVELPA